MATITPSDLISLLPADNLTEDQQVAELRLLAPIDLHRQMALIRVICAVNRSTWHFRREALVSRVINEKADERRRERAAAYAASQAQVAE